MNKLIFLLYRIFFSTSLVISIINEVNSSNEGYPLWMTFCEVVVYTLSILIMILSFFKYKPPNTSWIWRVAPFVIIAHFLFEWYFAFFVFSYDEISLALLVLVTISGWLVLFPLIYISFWYGYSSGPKADLNITSADSSSRTR